MTHVQIAIVLDQNLNSLVAVMRTVTSRGLFAEEYDEHSQRWCRNDTQLRQKITKHTIIVPKEIGAS